jgi:acetate kinase
VKRGLQKTGFADAFKAMTAELSAKATGVIGGAGEVSVVAHRVVHGGEKFTEGRLITDEVLAQIEALNPLAPLHNPVNVAGIREMRRLFPAVPHVAVFDSAFHHTLPAYAYLYGLPYEFYEKKGIRRYGFHGTSHHYVSLRAAQFLKRRPNELRLVSCHLGNGSSLCAVDHGRSVDTTMGFTPAEGLIMGTRCGDVDAGVLAFLERTEKLTATQSEELLNRKSGLLGLSGISSDMREILKAAGEGRSRALLALKTYCYRVRKYIGAYVAAMGGVDTVIFTGGIGQGSAEVRTLALQGLDCMGLRLDEERNRDARGFEEICRVSTDDSKVVVLVVPTDEERMMAREALHTLSRSYITRALEAQKKQPFPVEVSAHHIHLTQPHVEALFGKGHQLTRHADLSQPGQYACKEQLAIVGPKGRIERVRVLGPVRKYTQVEIAMTEQFKLGVHPPIRESGDIADTPGCALEGSAGSVKLERGVICALRHVHMTPEDALRYGVRDKSVVRVRIAGDRELVFGDVLVRVDPNFALAMHIDTDEANAANAQAGAQGFIDGIQSEG